MQENKQTRVNGYVDSACTLFYIALIKTYGFMVLAGAGVGLTGGPLTIQAWSKHIFHKEITVLQQW